MKRIKSLVFALAVASGTAAFAGPVVIEGTDANDHGISDNFVYITAVFNNLAGQVGNGGKIIVDLGTQSSTEARTAIDTGFSNTSLGAAGWSVVHIDNAADITSFLGGGTVQGASLSNAGILYVPTYNNTDGDLSSDELTAINNNASVLANFVGGAGTASKGGGLFSEAESDQVPGGPTIYGWLQTLIPGIVLTDLGSGGSSNPDLTLTAAGHSAFPSLTDADLSTGPWHNYFSGNFGSLSSLATGTTDDGVTRDVVLGGGQGTVIAPTPPPTNGVPLPAAAWMGLSTMGAMVVRKLRRK